MSSVGLAARSLAFVRLSELDDRQKRGAGSLIVASLPDYYRAFFLDEDKLLGALAEQMDEAGTEISSGVAMLDEQVAGVYCALNSERLRSAQLNGLRFLMPFLDPEKKPFVRKALAGFGASIEPISENGCYLSRFTVRDDLRGQGAADVLLRAFLDTTEAPTPALLHVHKDNTRARKFYERNGFRLATAAQHTIYPLMRRPNLSKPRGMKE